MESITPKKISLLKSIVWRAIGVGMLASITYFFTRRCITTTYITFVHHATFILVYYLHERVWLRIGNIRGRAVAKSLIYEIALGMGLGGLIVLIFTGEWTKVGQITLTYTAVKIITYVVFEQVWESAIKMRKRK